MTGLNLETFLRLLKTDPVVWTSLGVIGSLLGLMLWTSLRARKLLRRCLAASVLLHVGVIATGGQTEWGQRILHTWDVAEAAPQGESLSRIEVESEAEGGGLEADLANAAKGGRSGESTSGLAIWDRPSLKASKLLVEPMAVAVALRPQVDQGEVVRREEAVVPPAQEVRPAVPELPAPVLAEPEQVVAEDRAPAAPAMVTPAVEAGDLPEVREAERRSLPPALDPLGSLRSAGNAVGARPAAGGASGPISGPSVTAAAALPSAALPSALGMGTGGVETNASRLPTSEEGLAPEGPLAAEMVTTSAPELGGGAEASVPALTPAPALVMPGRGNELERPGRPSLERPGLERPLRPEAAAPLAIARNMPDRQPDLPRVPLGPRALPEVPEVYRPRLDRNRSEAAQRAGASAASEESVERALVWLARHQDRDGRWDAATGRDAEGRAVPGEDDFTAHCPPGEICFGTCHYWEADTAMTGLALLSYLGAGYTHQEGKHAATVGRGLDFLLAAQKPSGDLRGASVAVGMYCHAMASLALCEAYALTGDAELKGPASRAVEFLVKSRAVDGMSWRYEPGAPVGDTSILGWVILVLKSAKEIGFDVPPSAPTGAARWLRLVSSGRDGGLATYQPGQPVTPTMTAEAWVCRQFLGVGGPGPSSAEAAEYVLAHPPSEEFNVYYWYYATLSMYQYGGAAWQQWNGGLRDQVVKRQRRGGHQDGSWDPDESRWGRYGGRVYTTALSTLTLEVYYRYLRLYDEPGAPPAIAPRRDDGTGDGGLRRASGDE